jgi:hypothetical protein
MHRATKLLDAVTYPFDRAHPPSAEYALLSSSSTCSACALTGSPHAAAPSMTRTTTATSSSWVGRGWRLALPKATGTRGCQILPSR